MEFERAWKSFKGYLEGTGKAAHTIASYESDLRTFKDFLNTHLGSKPVAITKLGLPDLDRYYQYLKQSGLKTNSRRRKLLTVRRFLRYLTQRKKVTTDFSGKIPAPHKLERVPKVLDWKKLESAVRALPGGTDLEQRNRVLLWTLLETGCQVSELGWIRAPDWVDSGDRLRGPALRIAGKNPREVPVSRELLEAARSLPARSGGVLFLGFNKFGPMGHSAITPRGVELLVRAYADRLSIPELTPRVFRHSAVVHWYREGVGREEIRARLGLKSDYAFRAYGPLFEQVRSNSRTTSTAGSPEPAP